MSRRQPAPLDLHLVDAAMRLCATLAREPAGRSRTPREIADDARALVHAACGLRDHGPGHKPSVELAQRIARHYDATCCATLAPDNKAGLLLLSFASAAHPHGYRGAYRVA